MKKSSFYIVDKVNEIFHSLSEIKDYMEQNLNPVAFASCWVEKYNGQDEVVNTYYVYVSRNGKVYFK